MTTYNDILNPFAEIIASGLEIRQALADSAQQLNLALENEAAERRTAKELKTMYDEAEVEFTVEANAAATGSNAEKRKAEVEAALVKARQSGPLSRLWAQANAAAYNAADAKIGLDQCANRFRATEAAAELTAAMLRAAAR
jgi:hypothetical protein